MMDITYHKNGSSDGMSMMTWIATEGGRKCPQCGRYASKSQLGFIGGTYLMGDVPVRLSMYGHLPGFGCNRDLAPAPDDAGKEGKGER